MSGEAAGLRLWPRIRAGYDQWALLAGFTCLPLFAYFAAANGLPSLMFLWGLLCLWHLRSFRGFLPVAACSALMLLLGFLRSDFAVMVMHGSSPGDAYAASTRYFQAPMIMWFTAWALVLACRDLAQDQTPRVMAWLAWLVLGLSAVQLLEGVSHLGLRTFFNTVFHHGHRPEWLVVYASNTNAILSMLFWPLSLWFMRRRNFAAIIIMLLAIVLTAVVVDTNSQIMALAIGLAVFAATRCWPPLLARRGVSPERLMAVASSLSILAFPALIWWLMRSGLAMKIKTDLLPSWAQRIDIWTFAVTRSTEKPWFGWGYEASRAFDPAIPNHPHNLALQAWLELGVPGLVVLAALWFCIFWFMAPAGQADVTTDAGGLRDLSVPIAISADAAAQLARPYFLAAAVAYFAVNMVSYGLWRAWYYSLGGLVVAVSLLALKAVRAEARSDKAERPER